MSIPAKTEMISNIFAFDKEKMQYSQGEYNNDIMQIGLYEYNELAFELNINEEVFVEENKTLLIQIIFDRKYIYKTLDIHKVGARISLMALYEIVEEEVHFIA